MFTHDSFSFSAVPLKDVLQDGSSLSSPVILKDGFVLSENGSYVISDVKDND